MLQPSDLLKYCQEALQSKPRVSLGAGLITGFALMQWAYCRRRKKAQLYKKIEEKLEEQKENFASILRQVGKEEIDDEEERILRLTLNEVLQEMKDRRVTCSEVLKAYQKKAYQVTKKVNCVVEFVLEAKDVAKELDNHPDPSSLPLYGLPIAVKLCCAFKGHLKSEGYARDLFNGPAEEDAITVAALKRLGAVPFVITNVPQTMCSARTNNPIFGETLNPYDLTRSSGGSSGGNGALVSAGGALTAVGTDLGGSIRIPSTFCGIVGFKQTGNRFSIVSVGDCVKGLTGLQDNTGFHSKDVDGLVTMFKSMYHPISRDFMQNEDVNLPPLNFDKSMFESRDRLCIGYTYGFEELLPITPVARRAVDMAVDALKAKGHKLVRYDYPDPQLAHDLIGGIITADGYQQMSKRLAEDIPVEHIAAQFHLYTPRLIKNVLGLIGYLANVQSLLPYAAYRGISAEKLWDLFFARFHYVQQVKKSWDRMGIEAVVAPAYACPALKLDDSGKALMIVIYTIFYNFLDFPAGVVPMTRVTPADVKELIEGYPRNGELTSVIYNSAPGSEGLPMSAQIVAPRWRDELVLRIMKEVEEGAKL